MPVVFEMDRGVPSEHSRRELHSGVRPLQQADEGSSLHATPWAALEAFVRLAVTVLSEERAARDLLTHVERVRGQTQGAASAIELLAVELRHAIQGTLARSEARLDSFVLDAASRLSRRVAALCESERMEAAASYARMQTKAEWARTAANGAKEAAVHAFLLGHAFAASSFTLSLVATDGPYHGELVRELGRGVVATYDLTFEETPWTRVRRLAEIAGRVSLPLGTERGWLARTLHADRHALGAYFVERVTLGPDVIQLVLSKRDATRGGLAVELGRYDEGVTCLVTDMGAVRQTRYIPAGESEDLERLWTCVSIACEDVVARGLRVRHLAVDGEAWQGGAQAEGLVDRLQDAYVPLAAQLLMREPENVEPLRALVATLDAEDRRTLAPLGLTQEARADSSLATGGR